MNSEPNPKPETTPPRRGRFASRLRTWLLAFAAVGCALVGTLGWVLQAGWFQERIARRLAASLEASTGVRVEWTSFAFDPWRLEVDLRNFVLHGREGPQEQPLFAATRIEAQWNLLSIWELTADLSRLRVTNPRISIAVSGDGQSNLPTRAATTRDRGAWFEPLFSFRVRRLELLRGEFRWNDDRRPLDFRAENFLATLDLDGGMDRFRGRLDFQNGSLSLEGRGPVPSRVHTEFFLYSDRAEITALDWRTARSHLAAQGTVDAFRSPQIRLRYDLQADLREAGSYIGAPGWEGDLRWTGEGGSGATGWEFAGDMEARIARNGIAQFRDVRWSARSKLRVTQGTAVEGNQNSSPWQAQFDGLEVMALGGQLDGSGTVDVSSSPPTTRLHLQAQRISLPALLQTVRTERFPVEQLNWAGAISGPVQVEFAGVGRNLRVSGEWQVEPPPVVPPGFLPVSAKLRGNYQADAQRVETQELVLNFPETRLSATGWLDAKDSALDLEINTTRLEESRPLARLLGERYADLPFQLSDQGSAEARIRWTGGFSDPRFEGDFRLRNFSYQNTLWDEFVGTLRYQGLSEGEGSGLAWRKSPGSEASQRAEVLIRSGRLLKGQAAAQFDARIGIEDGAVTPTSPFSVEGTVRNADLEELQRLLRVSFPIRGTLEASGHASGTQDDPRAEGTVAVQSGAVYDEPFDRLTARVAMENRDVVSASEVRVERGATRLAGNATVNRRTEEYRFAATVTDLPLSDVRFLKPDRFSLSGLAQITLTGEGSRDRPRVEGKIEVRNLALEGREAGTTSLDIETRDRRAHLRGTANLFGTEMRVTSETLLEEPFPTATRFEFEGADVPGLIRTLRPPPANLTGRADGTLLVEGDLRHPEAIVVRGDLPAFDGALGAADFRADRPVRFRYQSSQVQLEQFHVAGTSFDLEATGGIRLGDDPALSLTARGRADLAALPPLDPQLAVAGRVSLDAVLNGTIARPIWRGQLIVSDASARFGDLPNSLTEVQGTIVFDGNRGFLEDVTAISGGGLLRLGGFLSYEGESGLRVQLTADTEDVRVRYPAGVSTVVSGRLTLSGDASNSLLGGQVVIRRESISPGFDLAQALLGSRSQDGAPPSEGFLRNMRLDLEVTSAPDIRFETAAARNLQGDAELRIRGTFDRPVLLGRIGIQEGELYFAGKRYTVSRGEITFVNPFRIEPILNLSVQARVQQYDISMDFIGPPDRLTLTYRSDPPLPTRDILALLVAGNSGPRAGETTATQPVPELGASSLLSQALTAQIGSRLDRIFGQGRVRVDPQLSGLGRPLDASVAFEQQIRDNLTVTYITNVATVREQIIRGEWAISPRYSLAAIRDQNGLVGVNLQMTLRFR
jgi:translocation and assembly module TamB